jgi:acyl carrier protein
MVPSAFVAMTAIPRTPSGKTDHRRLPPIPAASAADGVSRAPRNEIEDDLAAIWKEILGVDALGIDDDFLHLGGDSLKAAQIAARVADRFNCDVPASAALRLETVARMAEALVVATSACRGSVAAWPG